MSVENEIDKHLNNLNTSIEQVREKIQINSENKQKLLEWIKIMRASLDSAEENILKL